jgi:predicted small integral membrane protein
MNFPSTSRAAQSGGRACSGVLAFEAAQARGLSHVRALKSFMVLAVGLWSLLIALDNVLDYQANWQFVRHVLSMDTVFPTNVLRYRAITNPAIQTVAYISIVVFEWLMAALCIAGAWRLFRSRSSHTMFAAAKPLAAAGLVAVFALYYCGFVIIGGEWFGMWQSPVWNGQEKAIAFVTCAVLVLVALLVDEGARPSA